MWVNDVKGHVIMRAQGVVVDWLVNMASEYYGPFVTLDKNGKKMLLVECFNAIYGTMVVGLLYYCTFADSLDKRGFIHVDAPVTMTAGGGDGSPELTLRQILPRYLRTDDRKSPLIAEIHQIRMNGPVEVVVPKAKVAEKVVTAMNYQSAAYLKYYLMDCGLDENFVTRLVVASCCPNLVAEINQYDWDEDLRELKAIKEKEDDSKLALFEQADWYFDLEKISVSPQKKKNLEYTAPEALFNWDETHSVNTLHAKNDARRATARRLAEGSTDSEEEDEGSEPEQHTLGKSSNDTEIGNAGEDGNKSITWSPASPSDGRHAGNSAAGGG